jgi:hypothetical protein
MRAPGVIDMIQLAVGLVFALPAGLFGLQLLADGRLLGVAFLAIAALMLALPHFLWTPPSPGDVVKGAVGWVTGKGKE